MKTSYLMSLCSLGKRLWGVNLYARGLFGKMLLDGHLEGRRGTRLGWRECGAATQLQVRPQGGTVELIVKAGDPHSNESLIPAFRGV